MARPNWEYIRVDVLLPNHPKLDGLTYPSKWTLLELWCHCGQNLTDGFVREAVWKVTGTANARRQLVEHGLAIKVSGGYRMHDYLEHQRSRLEVEDLRKKRAEAGRRGGRAAANAKQMPQQVLQQSSSKPAAEAEAEAEAEAKAVARAEVSIQSNGSNPRPFDRDEINQFVVTKINSVTGKIVPLAWAAKVADHILEGRHPVDPRAYIRQAIENEPDPKKRFLPQY